MKPSGNTDMTILSIMHTLLSVICIMHSHRIRGYGEPDTGGVSIAQSVNEITARLTKYYCTHFLP